MQSAIVSTWTHPIAGRERKSLAYAVEAMDYWGKQASEGKCSQPEVFFSDLGHGMWRVQGDQDTLQQIYDGDEARMLRLKGQLLLENFSTEFWYAGDGAADYLQRWETALSVIE